MLSRKLGSAPVELSCIQIDKQNGQVRVWPPGEGDDKSALKSPASSNSDSARIKVCNLPSLPPTSSSLLASGAKDMSVKLTICVTCRHNLQGKVRGLRGED